MPRRTLVINTYAGYYPVSRRCTYELTKCGSGTSSSLSLNNNDNNIITAVDISQMIFLVTFDNAIHIPHSFLSKAQLGYLT